jgi:exosortase family protein XrtF
MSTFAQKIKDFKPAILFLAKFIGIYFIGNIFYGLYVTAFEPRPDPVTVWVTEHTARVLSLLNHEAVVIIHPRKPTTLLQEHSHTVVSVFEGCNGLNIMIIFVAFLFAFGPVSKRIFTFSLVGILLIHFFNLLRIAGLYLIVLYIPDFLYFTHKYLFTAFIYLVVLILWLFWVKKQLPVQHRS